MEIAVSLLEKEKFPMHCASFDRCCAPVPRTCSCDYKAVVIDGF